MFCALYLATLEVTGRYDHFRPAINAVRSATALRSSTRYRHALVDYNNAPSRTLTDVQVTLDSAIAALGRDVAARRAPDGASVPCGRGCLLALADDYLDALIRHDPRRLRLAADVRYTENGAVLFIGEGLWKSVTAVIGTRQYVVDAERQGVGVLCVVREDASQAIFLARLAAAGGEIREIETIVVRSTDNPFFDPERQATLAPFDTSVPTAQRASRGELLRIADAYFSALDTQGTPDYRPAPLAVTANRYENGVLTTNVPGARNILGLTASEQFDRGVFRWRNVVDRRYPLVDEEQGLVLAFATFRPSPVTKTLLLSEIFQIANGELQEIRAAMVDRPPGAPTGWP